MLKGVETKIGEFGGIFVAVNATYTAFIFWAENCSLELSIC